MLPSPSYPSQSQDYNRNSYNAPNLEYYQKGVQEQNAEVSSTEDKRDDSLLKLLCAEENVDADVDTLLQDFTDTTDTISNSNISASSNSSVCSVYTPPQCLTRKRFILAAKPWSPEMFNGRYTGNDASFSNSINPSASISPSLMYPRDYLTYSYVPSGYHTAGNLNGRMAEQRTNRTDHIRFGDDDNKLSVTNSKHKSQLAKEPSPKINTSYTPAENEQMKHKKPSETYVSMIAKAMLATGLQGMSLSDLYSKIEVLFSYYKTSTITW